MSQGKSLSRRAVLRGLGVSMALPWMEAFPGMSALTSTASAATGAASGAAAPVRMAYLFVCNGVNLPKWTPRQEGIGFDLPYILEPLAPVRDDVLVLSGLTHDKGRANGDGAGDHARSASVFLTGAQPRKTAGGDIRSGVSVDQYAAQRIGSATRFRSLELGCEPGGSTGNCDSGYSCAYSHNIAWAGPAQPVNKEVNPRAVFDRLFGGDSRREAREGIARREALKRSILDFVSDDAKRLQASLGKNDQRKLDEYLSGVREIERRIERGETNADGPEVIDYNRPPGVPREYAEHLRLMADMMVLAFQSDSTRIATFMFTNAGSNRNYREIGVRDGHHDLSHHGGDPTKLDKIAQINRFHIQQFTYLLERLRSIREGNGTLLDNSMIVYGSGLSDGNRHNNENLPVLLAGRGGGTNDPGRHVRFKEETPMCNLFTSMLDRVGVNAPFIGDSTGRLRGLQV